ncbi:uncharacterized protein LOC129764670 [Toxorhynchites rutilus septentrionalis]|uniref:uncharacterized protein LOC129764670 n=1 Tax=Toxorhynchites rutilus septentrionalis TaxID=329112 RepID=UPI00247995C2|nr:uncharacterized protein LOC129764670 [Toxorhynchites rutilus septentrionalis]
MMRLSTTIFLFMAMSLGQCLTRTYNLQTEEDRNGKYERALLGLKTSEGLRLDKHIMQAIREVIWKEEATRPMRHGYRLVAVHWDKPMQSREIAQLQYRNKVHH